MEYLGDFLKILLPSALVIYAVYLVLRSFGAREDSRHENDLRIKSREIAFPIRLQAYERLILFLERVNLANIIGRTDKRKMSTILLYNQILSEVRDEYNHNLSQQVYVSDKAWDLLTNSKERTIAFVNKVFSEVDPESEARVFAKALLDKMIAENQDFTGEAIHILKEEIRELY